SRASARRSSNARLCPSRTIVRTPDSRKAARTTQRFLGLLVMLLVDVRLVRGELDVEGAALLFELDLVFAREPADRLLDERAVLIQNLRQGRQRHLPLHAERFPDGAGHVPDRFDVHDFPSRIAAPIYASPRAGTRKTRPIL